LFHFKLIQLESDLLAKSLSNQETELTPDCEFLLQAIEAEIGLRLADTCFKGWQGWITYRRKKSSLVVCRGRSFAEGVFFRKYRAGFDAPNGMDAVTDYQRRFDVTPSQDIDHLLINFRPGTPPKILVFYGENLAPYQLFFEEEADMSIQPEVEEAIAQGCVWILEKPKGTTIATYLEAQGKGV